MHTTLLVEDAATRREFLAILAASGLVAACGEDEAKPGPTTRTVETSHGSVRIPADPRRVVAMHDQLVAYAVASLGFEHLIAIAGRDAKDPAVAVRQFGKVPEAFEGLEPIGTYAEPDVEAIAALRPDLIIGLPDETDPIYRQLSKLAPTAVVALQEGERPPFQRQRDLAAILGVEDALDERLREYRAALESARPALGALAGKTYTYIESFGSGAEDNYVIRSDYAPGLMVLEDLGMTPAPSTRGFKEEYNAVSPELLPRYDADYVFVGLPEELELDRTTRRLLGTTDAARGGRLFTVSRDIWALEVAEALFGVLEDVQRLVVA